MVQSIIDCPVHFGTLYIWHECTQCSTCGSLHGLSVTSGSCSWSELDSSSWLLSTWFILSGHCGLCLGRIFHCFRHFWSLLEIKTFSVLSKQLYYWLHYAGCTLLLVGCVFDLYFDFDRVPWDSELLLSGLFQGNINVVLTEKQFASLLIFWLIPLLFEVVPL